MAESLGYGAVLSVLRSFRAGVLQHLGRISVSGRG